MPLARPQLITWPTAQTCALTRNQTRDVSVCGTMPDLLSHTSQIRKPHFKWLHYILSKVYVCFVQQMSLFFFIFKLFLLLSCFDKSEVSMLVHKSFRSDPQEWGVQKDQCPLILGRLRLSRLPFLLHHYELQAHSLVGLCIPPCDFPSVCTS